MTLARELGSVLPRGSIVEAGPQYLADQTEGRGLRGRADAVVLPSTTSEVARLLAWCYAHDVPLVPRGGGTGYAGGAVPLHGGIVLKRVFDPKGLLNPGKKAATRPL